MTKVGYDIYLEMTKREAENDLINVMIEGSAMMMDEDSVKRLKAALVDRFPFYKIDVAELKNGKYHVELYRIDEDDEY